MRFVCESCRAQYMINDDKVGPKGVKVRCRKCGYVITVKRTDAGAARPSANGQGGGASSSDAEDGLATQVMQTPLGAGADATLEHESPGDLTSPGLNTTPSPNSNSNSNSSSPSMNPVDDDPIGKNFLGADDDEIGAVFDQVLKTGPVVKERLDEALGQRSEDDRQSTRVIDAQTVAALAKESETSDSKLDPVPDGNWFVAINEKQTGPLSLDKLKENWDRGEIGPDSLCWREGFSDWIPLSEVKALAVILAPKPPKPIVVPTATIPTSAPAVMSVPVQSAFSAGGLMQTVQSEVQVPISAAPSSSISEREESGTWKPSAASALASLVKDEMEALAKPPPKPVQAPVDDVPTRGLLDLPGNEEKAAAAAAVAPVRAAPEPARPPTNPYLANPGATYSAPAITQYRPQSNRGLIIGLSAGAAVIVLMLIGLIIWIVNRQPVAAVAVAPVATAPVAAPNPTPAPVPTPTPAPTPVAAATAPTAAAVPAPAVPVPAPGVAAAQPVAAAAAVPAPVPVAAKETAKEPARVVAAAPVRNANPVRTEKAPRPEREPAPAPEPKEQPKKAAAGDSDDFESAFGGGSSKSAPKKEKKEEAPTASRKGGYIPDAPGSGGDVKDALGTSDILEVVSANKPALAKCAEEQRKRDPSTSGKLVMRWTIQTTGKVSRVDVVSEEFKGTYMAGCVGGLIKAMVFPRHKTQGEPVTFPFKF